MTSEREPLEQALYYVLRVLQATSEMSLKDETFDEVAAQENQLGEIKTRVDLILSYLMEMKKPSGLRLIRRPN